MSGHRSGGDVTPCEQERVGQSAQPACLPSLHCLPSRRPKMEFFLSNAPLPNLMNACPGSVKGMGDRECHSRACLPSSGRAERRAASFQRER